MKQNILELYHTWSKFYNPKKNLPSAVNQDKVIPALAPRKSDIILDIGCGDGRFTVPLAKRCKRITGIDSSKEMLELARKKSKNIEYKKVDVEKGLPFKDNSFDKILCILVIDHMKKLDFFYKEVHRVLKKDGSFLFDEFVSNMVQPIRTRYYDPIMDFHNKGKSIYIMRTIHDHLKLIKKYGFEIKDMISLRITDEVKNILTRKSFEANNGRYISLLIKLKKP